MTEKQEIMAEEQMWDRQAREARDEFRKVKTVMPKSHFDQFIPAK